MSDRKSEMAARRILFVTTEDWFFMSHFLPRAQAAIAAGYDVTLATRVNAHYEELSNNGIKVIPLPWKRRGSSPIDELRALLRIVQALRQDRSTILHNFALKPILFGSLAARLAGTRRVVNAPVGMGVVYGSRHLRERILRLPLMALLRLLLNPRGSRVVFENPDDLETLVSGRVVRRDDTRLIRGAGVDLADYETSLPRPQRDVVTVTLVARMLVEKGVVLFHDAATSLATHRNPSYRFLLVGEPDDGNSHSVSRETLRAWDEEGNLEWLGRRTDIPEILRNSDIFCLPTYYREGLPKALLEAAASALPIVTTDTPGCREVVTSGINGVLVKTRDLASLVDALQHLGSKPELRDAYGRESLVRAQRDFSVGAVNQATLDVYRELTEEDGGADG